MLSAPSPSNRGRPDYRRLALQALEQYPSKRPPLRRGYANFNSALEDQGNDGAMDGFESDGVSDAGGSERAYGHDQRTHGKGPGALGDEYERGVNTSARRRSEPAATAPRMIMRMPGGGSGGN